MMDSRTLSAILVLALMSNGLCVPIQMRRFKRESNSPVTPSSDTTVTTSELSVSVNNNGLPPSIPIDKDDEDPEFEESAPVATETDGGGSNILSLFHLSGSVLPGASSASAFLRNLRQIIVKRYRPHDVLRHEDVTNGYVKLMERRQDIESGSRESNSNSDEEINNGRDSEQDSSLDSDEDYDEPPGGGDGQGGGLLGLLSGLSGGEDGQSDLGSLLATVSGIIANLSGDGIDLNSLIASGIGLFVGLLSEGDQNPGAIVASYLLTSLDTITGGGANNNGAFFGNFLSKLVKGISAGSSSGGEGGQGGGFLSTISSLVWSLLASVVGFVVKSSGASSLQS